MSTFGGRSSFGSAHFGGDRYPTPQGYIIGRMIAAMSGFTSGASPVIRTCARLYGDPSLLETWDAVLTPGGLPAVLVHYARGTYVKETTSAARMAKRMQFVVYCFGGDYRSLQHRVEGKSFDDGAAEQLTAWCAYYMYRALNELKLRAVEIGEERPLAWSANVVGYTLSFTATQSVDFYDDAIALKLERLGICHSPKNLATLFESDNVTPKSGDEPVPSSNVADLTEE